MFLMTLRRLEVRLLINTRQRGAKGGERRRGEAARGWDRGREERGGEEKKRKMEGERKEWKNGIVGGAGRENKMITVIL